MVGKRPGVERLLDIAVFAPLGLLLNREQTVNDLAAAGRKQVAFAQSLGRAALKGITKPPAPRGTASAPSGEVPGYDAMTARQVIDFVGSCSESEADWIRTKERSGKKRVTVLRALGD